MNVRQVAADYSTLSVFFYYFFFKFVLQLYFLLTLGHMGILGVFLESLYVQSVIARLIVTTVSETFIHLVQLTGACAEKIPGMGPAA